ncbi:hypothetical protein EV130_107118 [Rhizobium azibense]|uniref:Uncharacterized protein n=1 Tax=Rhizobium azibense TaxID=1136135 RepID=A0A4R3QQX3_9HYPH|nr:hypothetical protein EV130_107118 [Rhizobium azibense]TCU36033.1 hypothetical protein EV129_108119 [Rhizobium azibense]
MPNKAVSLLEVRKILNEFCAENGLSIGSAIAIDAAKHLIKITATDVTSAIMVRSSLDHWMVERTAFAA